MANIVDSDFRHDFTIEDADGVAQDVSAWTFEVRWYDEQTGKKLLTLTDGVGFVSDGTDGECKLLLTAAQTLANGPGNKRVVIWRTDSGNRVVIGEGIAPFQSLEFDA